MAGIQDTAAAAAKLASGGPGGHGGGALSMIGVGGWALEWKHGSAAIIEPFMGCGSAGEVFVRLVQLDDATFLGLGLFVAIMIASTVSLVLGLRRLFWNWLSQPAAQENTPPGRKSEEKDD